MTNFQSTRIKVQMAFYKTNPRRGLGYATALLLLLPFLACSGKNKRVSSTEGGAEPTLEAENPRLRLHLAEASGLDFVNEIEESHESNPTNNINIYNGGGVAAADVNNDSLPDLYFVNCSGKNKLFLNLGNFKFKDITGGTGLESADGFETSVTAVDINADGWMDFYVGRAGPFPPEGCKNRLFVNNGNLTFTERAAEYGLDVDTRTTGANFFDYDLDGDLDVYILNYPTSFDYTSKIEARLDEKTGQYHPVLSPKTPRDSDRLYRNEGNGRFTDVSKQAGIQNFAYGLSVTVSDFNGDHYPDVYVGNDFIQPDFLYINNRNGTFSSSLGEYISHTSQHTMGVDISDFDNDGLVDLIGVDMLPEKQFRQKSTLNTNSQNKYNTLHEHGYFESYVRNVLQHNNGNGSFSEIGCIAGVYKTDWSWSSLFMDVDNDGFKDLAITNGYLREVTDMDFVNFTFAQIKKGDIKQQFPNVKDFLKLIPSYKIRNYLFRNRGDWTFESMGGEWLTVPASWSNGAAYADFDRDGDLDWVINNLVDKPFLYENLTRSMPNSNYLQLRLVGSGQNSMAIGATATLRAGNQRQYLEMTPSRGIFSSVEHLFHFGLGQAGQADELVVRWPDGQTTTLTNVPANRRLTLRQAEANGRDTGVKTTPPPLLQEATAASGVAFRHEENDYLDFDAYFLQPWKESDLGPSLATGDVNGDGLDDFFIGNSFDKPAALYVQTADGRFRPVSAGTWKQDAVFEDHGALFFDADTDGDLDLLVISGGAEADLKFSATAWQNRLYINVDGKGTFAKTANVFPQTEALVGSRAAAYDYDNDGDPDLVVGGRVTPARWPTAPRTALLRNDRTHFTDVTAQLAPELERCGMVTDLQWANIDADPAPELLLTGEWMPLTVFDLEGGRLKNSTAKFGLDKSNGFWNRLVTTDVDKDGDLDLVAGNFGLNTRLVASATEPLRCYAKDFDGNGSIDPILAYYEDGRELPLMRQDALIKQIPALKKRLIYAKDYGKASMEDIYPRKTLRSATLLEVFTLASSWWENKGGTFVQHPLPLQAQLAPAYGLEVQDFDGDGNADILLAGNKHGIEVETGRCDAGIGALLLGDGRGGFRWAPAYESGFFAPGEVRDLALLRGAGGKRSLVVANNNAGAQVFRVLKSAPGPVQ
ncbi:MAG: VCBS repeat-containing protein [Saprospirales bacterium]|nr:VCBS repeat-containing protein [Saprospirales bacterium]